jgi:ElaB/YqjD/DUF883 family membrane-anchored ribosome-binding protein
MFASAEKQNLNGKTRSMHKTAARAARHVEDDAEDALSTIYDAAAAIKEDVESLAHSAGRRMRGAIDEAQTSVTEATGNATAVIRDNPIQSSVIALGVGMLFGLLMRRS